MVRGNLSVFQNNTTFDFVTQRCMGYVTYSSSVLRNRIFVWKIKLRIVTIYFSLQVGNAVYMEKTGMFDVVFVKSLQWCTFIF